MGFESDKAFNRLRDEGIVYSFRLRRGSYEGEVWINRGRGTEKEFDAKAQLVWAMAWWPEQILKDYQEWSGFDDVDEWIEEIGNLNGEIPEEGYLFLVEREP